MIKKHLLLSSIFSLAASNIQAFPISKPTASTEAAIRREVETEMRREHARNLTCKSRSKILECLYTQEAIDPEKTPSRPRTSSYNMLIRDRSYKFSEKERMIWMTMIGILDEATDHIKRIHYEQLTRSETYCTENGIERSEYIQTLEEEYSKKIKELQKDLLKEMEKNAKIELKKPTPKWKKPIPIIDSRTSAERTEAIRQQKEDIINNEAEAWRQLQECLEKHSKRRNSKDAGTVYEKTPWWATLWYANPRTATRKKTYARYEKVGEIEEKEYALATLKEAILRRKLLEPQDESSWNFFKIFGCR